MPDSLDGNSKWNFRVTDNRLIVVKTKNESVSKVAVLDVLTNIMFTIEVPDAIEIKEIAINKEYLINLKVYTSKDLTNIDKEFLSFFGALDINQSMEDFIKAYWIYPNKILFQLQSKEEP